MIIDVKTNLSPSRDLANCGPTIHAIVGPTSPLTTGSSNNAPT